MFGLSDFIDLKTWTSLLDPAVVGIKDYVNGTGALID